MPSLINADNGVVSGSVGLKYSTDNTGTLALQTNGNTAMTVDSSQNIMIARTSPAWANTRFSVDQQTNPAGLLSWYNGYPEAYATGNSPSAKFPYAPSGTQEVKNANSSASTVAGYLTDFIAYNGSTATTAYMGVSAGTTYAANMVFGQRTGVQSWRETMRIDTDGRVTMPLQPAFHAVANGTGALTGTIARFPNALVNISGSYNTSTMRFTAPIAGTYYFYAAIMADTGTGRMTWQFFRNGSGIGYNQGGGDSTNYGTWPGAMTITLAAGDYIQVNVGSGTPYNSNQEQSFGGYLLG
jgi:hypothetical protein